MRKRSRQRRGVQLVTAAVVVLSPFAAPSGAHAAGAGYYAAQCGDYYRATPDIGGPQESPPYQKLNRCTSADAALEITNTGPAVINQGGQFTMTAPSGTAIHEIHIDANLRRGSGHHAEVAVYNGSSVIPLVVGPDSNPQWTHYDFGGLDVPQLILRLYCTNGNCPPDGTAHLYARNIVVLLADNSDPSVTGVGGSLLDGGWQRATETFAATASDLGAGVSVLNGSVNGFMVAAGGGCDTGGLTFPYTGPIVPCQGSGGFTQSLNTAAAPFVDGPNAVRVAAGDYPGNASATVERSVLVDNTPPSLAFTNEQDPSAPETIRADVSDQHSGVAQARLFLRAVGATDWQSLETKLVDGQARAQVDSGSMPAGDYEFRATATDVAGNSIESTQRHDGTPMRLSFPLRDAVELLAHLDNGASKGQTVPYGTEARAEGRLLDAAGEPIADTQITVLENFGGGALIRERVSQAMTDADGHWSSKLPAGPNRTASASFSGTARYSTAQAEVGKLTVRSRVAFKTASKSVPEGQTMRFGGKVGHFGARIPAGGKLLELQVRLKTGRWDTVGQAFRTDDNGTYQRRYRFGKQYTQDALFRFRVKLKNEANWPFRRAASKQRKVIVRAD